MPELPEVECVRRSLIPLAGRAVVSVRVHRREVVVAPGDPEGGFGRQRTGVRPKRLTGAMLLAGARLAEPRRLGKRLALVGEGGRCVEIHLGMSGQVLRVAPGARPPRADHVHVAWRLDDGSRVLFRDPRRFGGVWALGSLADLERRWGELGADALTISARALGDALAGTGRALKACLLDQRVLAGVGNIYADEACWAAELCPARPGRSLGAAEVRRLAASIRRTLRSAIRAGGSTLRDFVDAEGSPGSYRASHAAYGRAGEPCRRCGRTLASGTLAQRTTVWCPGCQPTL